MPIIILVVNAIIVIFSTVDIPVWQWWCQPH